MADKVVQINGIGNVAFPDSMSDQDIATTIQSKFPDASKAPPIASPPNALSTANPNPLSVMQRASINLPGSLSNFIRNQPGPQGQPPVDTSNSNKITLSSPWGSVDTYKIEPHPLDDVSSAAHSIARIVTDFPERFAEDPVGTIGLPLQLLHGGVKPSAMSAAIKGGMDAAGAEMSNPAGMYHPVSKLFKAAMNIPSGMRAGLNDFLAKTPEQTGGASAAVAQELHGSGVASDDLHGAKIDSLTDYFNDIANNVGYKNSNFNSSQVVDVANKMRQLENAKKAAETQSPSRQIAAGTPVNKPIVTETPEDVMARDTSGPIKGWQPTVLDREPAPPSRQLPPGKEPIITAAPPDASGIIHGWTPTILENENVQGPASSVQPQTVSLDEMAQSFGAKSYDSLLKSDVKAAATIKDLVDKLNAPRLNVNQSSSTGARPMSYYGVDPSTTSPKSPALTQATPTQSTPAPPATPQVSSATPSPKEVYGVRDAAQFLGSRLNPQTEIPTPSSFTDTQSTGLQIQPKLANQIEVANKLAKYFYDNSISSKGIKDLKPNGDPDTELFWSNAGRVPDVSVQKNYIPSVDTRTRVIDALQRLEKSQPIAKQLAASVGGSTPALSEGSSRSLPGGQKQTLRQVPLEDISGDPGNRINDKIVAKYQKQGYTEPPELRLSDTGNPDTPTKYTIQEGHHRILADAKNGKDSVLAWTPDESK